MASDTDAEDRIKALHTKLNDGSISTEELDEMVDLLGMCGCTLTGEVPERFKHATKH
jgi:hypothetical protein